MILSIAWKNIWRSKVRSLVVIMAICFGLLSGIVAVALMNGMLLGRLDDAIQIEVSSLQLHQAAFMENDEIEFVIENSNEIIQDIARMPNVKAVSKRFKAEVMISSNRSASGAVLIAVEPDNEKKVTIASTVVEKYANEGEKIEIALKPSLQVNIQPNQNIITSEEKFILEGSVSDGDSQVFVNYNGERIELAIDLDRSFRKSFSLEGGINSIEVLAFKNDVNESFARIKGTIEYKEKLLMKNWLQIVGFSGISIAIILFAAWLLKKYILNR